MKAVLKPRRPSPDEALAIAATAAPQQPPAQLRQAERAGEGADGSTTLNLRMRRSSVHAIEAAARERGLTMKQVVAHALRNAGVAVADADLEDRTPRRK